MEPLTDYTPTPYAIYTDDETRRLGCTHVQAVNDESNDGLSLAICCGPQHYFNADFFVRACNAYAGHIARIAALEKAANSHAALVARVAELEGDAAKARGILGDIWLPSQEVCDWVNKYDAALAGRDGK